MKKMQIFAATDDDDDDRNIWHMSYLTCIFLYIFFLCLDYMITFLLTIINFNLAYERNFPPFCDDLRPLGTLITGLPAHKKCLEKV